MFDINALALSDSFDLQLRHPASGELLFADGEKQEAPIKLALYGTASKQYRNAVTAMQNRALRRKQKGEKDTAELLREESNKLLTACFAGSENLVYSGKVVDSEEVFKALIVDPKMAWIRDQVDTALGDVSNFLGQ